VGFFNVVKKDEINFRNYIMKCVYINLDIATNRNEKIIKNLEENKGKDWSIERYKANDSTYIKENKISGVIRDSEKACFLSHRNAINQNILIKEHLWILEDDARLGVSTSKIINEIMSIGNEFDWDIIFTDVCITEPTTMIELIKLRNKLTVHKQTQIINLTTINFAGASSYIINQKSINKILNLINEEIIINEPYDLYLRRLIYENKVSAFVLFPFPTTISSDAEKSQIQLSTTVMTDLIWNTFRKMIWLDRNFEDVNKDLLNIDSSICCEESKKFGTIISACISSEFVLK
jgi:GR25 family glycosyltransferase involved in LPS biosynthesis